MADFIEVVDAGPGWTKVRTSDGEIVTVEGNRNWRNNNPGNIEYGPFAQSMGAVGTDGRFAVFPSYDAGRSAKENLIFDSPNYRGLTLAEAISRYAPPVENNTQSYINQVSGAAGIPSSTTMASIPPSLRPVILDTMQKVEGWREGTRNGVPVPPLDIPNAVATQLDVIPPRLAPTPLMASSALQNSRAITSPSGGNTALQSALQQVATRERNRVTPASAEERVTARNRVPIAPTKNPALEQAARRAALTMNQSYAGQDRAPAIQVGPTPQQINQAARTAALKATQSYAGQDRTPAPQVTQLPRMSVPLAPVGSSNIASQRAEQLATRAKPIAAIPDRLMPSPAGLPALYGTMTPQQVAQIGVPVVQQQAPRPLPLAATSAKIAPVPASVAQMNVARNGSWQGNVFTPPQRPITSAFLAQQAAKLPLMAQSQQPLTIRVQGSNTIPVAPRTVIPAGPTAQQRVDFGNWATRNSGDTSSGSQAEAASARASGDGGRIRRY